MTLFSVNKSDDIAYMFIIILLLRNTKWDPKMTFLVGSGNDLKVASGTFNPDIMVQPRLQVSQLFDFFGYEDLFVKFLSEHKKAKSSVDDWYLWFLICCLLCFHNHFLLLHCLFVF